MIKASVLYPTGDGITFDIDYYNSTHMDIVKRTMKPARIEVDSGQNGPYIAAGHLYFDSPDALQAALGEGGEANADVPNFTNATPVIQVSAVTVH